MLKRLKRKLRQFFDNRWKRRYYALIEEIKHDHVNSSMYNIGWNDGYNSGRASKRR